MRHKSNFHQARTSPPALAFSIANPNQVPQLDAVIFRNLTYEVGRGSKKKTILNRINLTVPEGSIYGLLGPSGCGKTTMLKCMVGRIWPKSGSIMVFGLRPGEGQGEVPGRHVGYMPQEISIYEDFTIEETLNYFGKINRMSTSDIKKRVEFLLQFLDLPTKKRTVANLSGGQKRRVSLAAALVHSPPLLILDEPTVGVDPLLRQSIWQHLVSMAKQERISVIITTHYIEEARLANVVGLMRNGRILAEDSPDELMHANRLTNLEDVFLKLCVTDSSRRAARLATTSSGSSGTRRRSAPINSGQMVNEFESESELRLRSKQTTLTTLNRLENNTTTPRPMAQLDDYIAPKHQHQQQSGAAAAAAVGGTILFNERPKQVLTIVNNNRTTVRIDHAASRSDQSRPHETDKKLDQRLRPARAYVNEAVDLNFSSEDGEHDDGDGDEVLNFQAQREKSGMFNVKPARHSTQLGLAKTRSSSRLVSAGPFEQADSSLSGASCASEDSLENYLALQQMHWSARRAQVQNLLQIHGRARHQTGRTDRRRQLAGQFTGAAAGPYLGLDGRSGKRNSSLRHYYQDDANYQNGFVQWWKTLLAVTWKNYVRLRRNPPVLVFQFMLPAIQVILFCLCIGGEPFDVPVAIVNEELVPKSSLQFLNGLNKKIIRQIKYDNLTSAIEAVRRGKVWGAIHIPDKYSENLQSRLIMGEEVTNETISNGTIRVYPDLTNLHLAMTLETTFRETFINFARNSLEELGYDKSLADLPIKIGRPIYGSTRKEGYLEFMAPGVVISISYVMATGLTALAFILERRDGLLERSLVSGVQTSQILLAHAINQVFVMMFQIMLVLACTFFIFEIPSRGPFFWAVLLILLQGCTGMGFGLLVSAICAEENTAVMMVVGTFYTNLILAGIIWPIEAMPHWLRPVSYAQPQTLPTETLRHILSRGWGITEPGVLLGFAVTIGWLVVFLVAAGVIFKYSR